MLATAKRPAAPRSIQPAAPSPSTSGPSTEAGDSLSATREGLPGSVAEAESMPMLGALEAASGEQAADAPDGGEEEEVQGAAATQQAMGEDAADADDSASEAEKSAEGEGEGEEEAGGEGGQEVAAAAGPEEIAAEVADEAPTLEMVGELDLEAPASLDASEAQAGIEGLELPDLEGILDGGGSLAEDAGDWFSELPSVPATLAADAVGEAPALEAPEPMKDAVGWVSDAIPDEVDLSPAAVKENSQGMAMTVSMAAEPAMDLVEELDPTVRFAEIGLAGEEALGSAQDAMWSEISELPGAELVEGVDVDVVTDLEVGELPGAVVGGAGKVGSGAAALFDAHAAPVLGDLESGVHEATAFADAAQQGLIEDGWETIQTAQQDALAFGQDSVDTVKSGLGEAQSQAHDALGAAVTEGREGIHTMWDEAGSMAESAVSEAESQADAIREVFARIIDALPSIPFIGKVVDRIIDEMIDELVGMFNSVQDGITEGFDAVWAEAVAAVDDVRSLAEEGYAAFEDSVWSEIETFATETIPDTVDQVAELSEDVAGTVAEGAESLGSDLVDGVEDAVETAGDGLDEGVGLLEEGWDATTDLAEEGWDATTDLAEDAWEGTKELAGDAWDGATELGAEGWAAVEALGSQAIAGIEDLGAQLGEWVENGITEVDAFFEVVKAALSGDFIFLVAYMLKKFFLEYGPIATFERLGELMGLPMQQMSDTIYLSAVEKGLCAPFDSAMKIHADDARAAGHPVDEMMGTESETSEAEASRSATTTSSTASPSVAASSSASTSTGSASPMMSMMSSSSARSSASGSGGQARGEGEAEAGEPTEVHTLAPLGLFEISGEDGTALGEVLEVNNDIEKGIGLAFDTVLGPPVDWVCDVVIGNIFGDGTAEDVAEFIKDYIFIGIRPE